MSFSNSTARQTYAGDGATTTFPIPFDYIPGSASAVLYAYLLDNVDDVNADGTPLTEGVDYDLDPVGDNPTNLITTVGHTIANGKFIRIQRITDILQEVDLNSSGPNTPYDPAVSEEIADRTVHMIQELSDRVYDLEQGVTGGGGGGGGATSAEIPDWATATDYLEDQVVVDNDTPSNQIYRALSDHTSGGNFNTDLVAGKWELLPNGATGPQGPAGAAGADGAVGAQGAQGIPGGAGPNGADGIFAAIASQAEAEAGTNNTKGITPLRLSQGLNALLAAVPDFAALVARVLVFEEASIISRVGFLEATAEFANGAFSGSQKLVNNQAVPLALLGRFNPILAHGRGAKFSRDGVGAEMAEAMVQIKRKNDLTNRFSTTDIIMQLVEGTWLIGRKGTDQLDETLEVDGVTLSIVTEVGADIRGQVYYITDDMAGDDTEHFANSEIKWWGQEIPITV